MKEKEKMLDKKSMTLKLEKMNMQQIKESQISKNELSKKRSLQEKGITLIALVVTIIILLILAGVTLNIALSDGGLFSKTQEAAEKYKQAQSDEEEMVRQITTQMYSEYVGAEILNYTPNPKDNPEITITKDQSGLTDYTNAQGTGFVNVDSNDYSQKFSKEDLRWRIWDFDGNTLRIIGDPTEKRLVLEGAEGYNNGVYIMNHICKKLYGIYDEEGELKKGIEVANLRRSDIQKVSTYDYTTYKHLDDEESFYEDNSSTNKNETISFGETKPYNGDNVYCPAMWSNNDQDWKYEYDDENGSNGIEKDCSRWEEIESNKKITENNVKEKKDSITFRQSYYVHSYSQSEFVNDAYYNLIFKTTDNKSAGSYFLGTRYALIHSEYCTLGFHIIIDATDTGKHWVHGNTVFRSNGTNNRDTSHALRPIVSIDLKETGGTLTPKTNEDGKTVYELSFEE